MENNRDKPHVHALAGLEPTSDHRRLVYPSIELAEDNLSFYGELFLGLALVWVHWIITGLMREQLSRQNI